MTVQKLTALGIKPGTTQKIAVGAASVQSAALGAKLVRLVSPVACHIVFAANPTAMANDCLLPANLPEYFMCNPTDLLAVIQDAAGGSLYITQAQ